MSAIWEGGDAAAGAKIFKAQCAQCHNASAGGANKQGPNLWNIFEGKGGSLKSYRYSKAAVEKAVVFDGQSLFDYLADPRSYIPGTKMVFAGLKQVKDRRDLIAYLRTKKD